MWGTTLLHGTLSHTPHFDMHFLHTHRPPPSLFSFLPFPSHFHLSLATYWKKLTCGVIRSFDYFQPGQRNLTTRLPCNSSVLSNVLRSTSLQRQQQQLLYNIYNIIQLKFAAALYNTSANLTWEPPALEKPEVLLNFRRQVQPSDEELPDLFSGNNGKPGGRKANTSRVRCYSLPLVAYCSPNQRILNQLEPSRAYAFALRCDINYTL